MGRPGAGNWFCSPDCVRVREELTQCVQRGSVPMQGCEDVSWQILRGSDGSQATDAALATAQHILQVAARGCRLRHMQVSA